MSTDQSRTPKGQPTGGQFAPNEHAIDEISLLIANHSLLPELPTDDEIVIYSHAEGDFDAEDLGFESIEVEIGDGTTQITAVSYLDFNWVFYTGAGKQFFGDLDETQREELLGRYRDDIATIVKEHTGAGLELSDGWEAAGLRVDIPSAALADGEDVLDIVRRSDEGKKFRALSRDVELQRTMWHAIGRRLAELDDHDQELRGINRVRRRI